MTTGVLLDDYLKQPASPLSDVELDEQLANRHNYDHKITAKTVEPSTVGRAENQRTAAINLDGISPESQQALSQAFAQIESSAEDAESVDTAVKTASHGVKVLAPLLNAISRWIDPKKDGAGLERIMGAVLGRVRKDALLVAGAYGVKPEDCPPWLTSQISGQIMELLIQAIDRNNGAVIEADNISYLAPLLNLAQQTDGIANSYYGTPSTPSLQLVNALTLAAADVMTEYHVFSYFHESPADIAQLITDYLNERVLEGSLQNMTDRFNLTDNERAYFGGTLLRGAGKLMAEAWSTNMAATLEFVKCLPKDQRREILVTGYPLDQVFASFEMSFQGLEISSISAMRSLAPHRENQIKDPGYAPGMR